VLNERKERRNQFLKTIPQEGEGFQSPAAIISTSSILSKENWGHRWFSIHTLRVRHELRNFRLELLRPKGEGSQKQSSISSDEVTFVGGMKGERGGYLEICESGGHICPGRFDIVGFFKRTVGSMEGRTMVSCFSLSMSMVSSRRKMLPS